MSAPLPRDVDPTWLCAFTPPDRLWAVLWNLERPATALELHHASKVPLGKAILLLRAWASRGFILTEVKSELRYAMTKAARLYETAPQANTAKGISRVPRRSGRQRLWSAMRVLKTFDLVTLQMAAEVNDGNTRPYLRALLACGYLTCRGDTWRLIRNTGPKHPIVTRRAAPLIKTPVLVDRNTGEVIDIPNRSSAASALADGGVS